MVGISVDGAVDPDEVVVLVGVFVSVGDVDCEADSVDEAVSVAPVDCVSDGDAELEEDSDCVVVSLEPGV